MFGRSILLPVALKHKVNKCRRISTGSRAEASKTTFLSRFLELWCMGNTHKQQQPRASRGNDISVPLNFRSSCPHKYGQNWIFKSLHLKRCFPNLYFHLKCRQKTTQKYPHTCGPERTEATDNLGALLNNVFPLKKLILLLFVLHFVLILILE